MMEESRNPSGNDVPRPRRLALRSHSLKAMSYTVVLQCKISPLQEDAGEAGNGSIEGEWRAL